MSFSANIGLSRGPLWGSSIGDRVRAYLGSARDSVLVIAPYIGLSALQNILPDKAPAIIVVTTWKLVDIAHGYSDLKVYPYLRERGGFLYLHDTLHMKIFSTDYSSAIISTANVTLAGLGMGPKVNRELALLLNTLTVEEEGLIQMVLAESTLVTDPIYDEFGQRSATFPPCTIPETSEVDLRKFLNGDSFLLSRLPMCSTPEALMNGIELLRSGGESLGMEERACVLHDIAVYGLDLHASKESNLRSLHINFFREPFICSLNAFLGEGRFFGEVKEWLQRTCKDVPIPRRRDLTGHVRAIFDWTVALGKGRFANVRPNFSEKLVRRSSS
jgi:hypothetical protein